MAKMNLNSFTLGEIAKVEELSGRSLGSMEDGEQPVGKFLAAIITVAKKRETPSFKFEDALNMGMEDANAFLAEVFADDEFADDEDDPKAN